MGWKEVAGIRQSNIPFGFGTLLYDVRFSEEGVARERAYYEALGRFVQLFAEVERIVAETLWNYAKTAPHVSKIVFAGAQSDTAATYIKAIAKAATVVAGNDPATDDSCKDLEYALQQFGIIRGVRNDILHFGASAIAEGKGIVSNAWKAKAEPTEFAISPEALDLMHEDLRKIIAHLTYRHLGRPWPKSPLAMVMLDKTLQSPWQYKHPGQPKSHAKTEGGKGGRKRAPKRPRQRRSSGA